jgi:hypothetical protein
VIHQSDSSEQRAAERHIISALASELGVSLEPGSITLNESQARLELDGLNREHGVLCEVYAHIGRLRGGQVHKVARDVLKLMAAELQLGRACRKILCFADEVAADAVRNKSWLAAVRSALGIQVRVVPLPPGLHSAVVKAQKRQVMINPARSDA